MVFQDFRLLWDRNVFDNVAFAQHIIQVPGRKDIQKNVLFALDLVGLNDKYRRRTNELSGGEQQRVAIARAIVNKPYLLIADEPTGNLDADTAWDVMQCFDRINREFGTTILIVTHDRGIVSRMGRRVIEMKKGEIISDTGSDAETAMPKRIIRMLTPIITMCMPAVIRIGMTKRTTGINLCGHFSTHWDRASGTCGETKGIHLRPLRRSLPACFFSACFIP